MVSTTVYFATNRKPDTGQPGGFGDELVNPAEVMYGVCEVTGIDLDHSGSGTMGVITARETARFAETVRAEILAPGKNLLVFIHGFDNSFMDGIIRGGFNRTWFAASNRPEADTVLLVFCWPALSNLLPGKPAPLDTTYLQSQQNAAASAVHVANFLREALGLVKELKATHSGTHAFLLAHSMGNHVLASAVEVFFAAGGPAALFDEVILAAGDEVATTLGSPDHSGMFRLRDMALRVSVYASKRDIAIAASMLVNRNARLGFDGPAGKTNPILYPEQTMRLVDCTEVFDLLGPDFDPIASHQYYRRSKTVRADITMLMAAGPVAPGISALRALPFEV
jgi:esterase/lipase superfamily enzyme